MRLVSARSECGGSNVIGGAPGKPSPANVPLPGARQSATMRQLTAVTGGNGRYFRARWSGGSRSAARYCLTFGRTGALIK
ncbi:hypothetical protein J6590_044111 [Homalodisca vitripennis]|nr:hypothetical protein J6590_044111 [Homalodisca vitripennis]